MSSLLPADDLRGRVRRVLEDFLTRQHEVLCEASPDLSMMTEAVGDLLRGGKRLRPAFCYWGWRGAGRPDGAEILRAATALELLHASALIHDDLMDDSDTRRGMPALHRRFAALHRDRGWVGSDVRFGNAAAILLGDATLVWSDELLMSSGLDDVALRRGRPVFDLMRTQVMGGQYLDVLAQASGRSSVEQARRVIRYKSAKYSVEHPLLLGGSLAGGSPDLLAGYSSYGLPLGEAFQLRDDVLGVFGDSAETGKPAGDDLREGKRTVLVAFALETATQQQAAAIESLLGDPGLDERGVERLREIIEDTKALARVERLIAELVDRSAAGIAAVDVDPAARRALEQLIVAATTRRV